MLLTSRYSRESSIPDVKAFYKRIGPNECQVLFRKECREAESNRRHKAFQASALPTELSRQNLKNNCS